jgi:hypothetical protein
MEFSVEQELLIMENVPMTQVSELYFVEDKYYVNERINGKWNLRTFNGVITTQEPGSSGEYYRKEIVNGMEHGRHNVFYKNGVLMEVGNWINGKRDGPVHFFTENGLRRLLLRYNMGRCVEEIEY